MSYQRGPLGIVIPVYNEGQRFNVFLSILTQAIVADLKSSYEKVCIVFVDDGSVIPVTTRASEDKSVHVIGLRHKVNLGQGAALLTGIEYTRDVLNCRYFVTMDSDGQHSPKDLKKILDKLVSTGAEIVFGSRFTGDASTNVPSGRKLLLKMAILFESLLTGVKTTDAHNGFRAFTDVFARATRIKQNKMAHATEFKMIVRLNKFKYDEEAVDITYSEASLQKGQSNLGALVILKDLLRMFIFDRG